ncbi:FAD/NAD(P)-binding protein [Micrococcus sp. FDAARGOS_333]|uniref:FAD/NAD(P)-binding protein n=1 Tax=Micrococcus sp. FDAARGOS_333 TaxID=1930558 RepID=UPI000B4E7A09|nr:FAD/NAD(P)-binding protein [Micrococcus sp. FDAARGOS_333]PNL17693.1 hypothetical protein CEQ11_005845 [Micrococcus sp. FDAARGOS_333]
MVEQGSIALVGGGPSAVYSLERLAAFAQVGRVSTPLVIHVFDKGGNFGDGEVHSRLQPQVSFLNRIAGQVSFAADETIEDADPLMAAHTRLTLAQWCEARYMATGDERYRVSATDWPKRFVHGEALRHFFDLYVGVLQAAGIQVKLHASEVVDIDNSGEKLELICADGKRVPDVGHALLVTGHSWNDPMLDPRRRKHADHARATNAPYVGAAYPLERGLGCEVAPPGSTVACEGMGLTAIDIVLYLTEGRGGSFVPDGERLRYVPSGEEPDRIIPFSRSGLFTFARPDNHKQVNLALHEHRPIFLSESAVNTIREARGTSSPHGLQIDFERDIFPLIRLEMMIVHATALLGSDAGQHLQRTVEPEVEAFRTASAEEARSAAEKAFTTLQDETRRMYALVDQRLNGVQSLASCRNEAKGWDFSLAAATFIGCVWGEALRSPIGTVLSAELPRVYLGLESPYGLPRSAAENEFDWDKTIRPIPDDARKDPEEYRRAMLRWFSEDDLRAAHGNLADPAKAAADGVWRDLRDVLAHAIDRGGLTPDSHRHFLNVYMRHHNRLANGAAREVMHKIHAAAENGVLDLGVGPSGLVTHEDNGYVVMGPETGFAARVDVLVDATVHAFDPRLDTASLYRNLLERGVVRLWENEGGPSDEPFVPGGLDLDETFSPIGATGESDSRITVLGPPSEGVVFFQLGALRPEQNHHVMRDILVWVAKLSRAGYFHSADQGASA